MSILLLGKSTCPICGLTINEADRYYSFPAFVSNTNDKLYMFNDSTFHLECLNEHEFGNTAKEYAGLFVNAIKPEERICLITREKITDPKDHIFIPYLTSNKDEYLHRFNFVHLCKSSLANWTLRKSFVEELMRLKDSGTWQESFNKDYLGKLINQLS